MGILSDKTQQHLGQELDQGLVKSRPDGFPYIPIQHIIQQANQVFGYDGWSSEILSGPTLVHEWSGKNNEGQNVYNVIYRATCRVKIHDDEDHYATLWRDNGGTGAALKARDPSRAHDTAMKAAISDAQKRALWSFGNQFGLSLGLDDHQQASGGQSASQNGGDGDYDHSKMKGLASQKQINTLRQELENVGRSEDAACSYIADTFDVAMASFGEEGQTNLPKSVASQMIDLLKNTPEQTAKKIRAYEPATASSGSEAPSSEEVPF